MKLIRDKYIDIIPKEDLFYLDGEKARLDWLKTKMDEELAELKASNFNDIGEYADVLEVLLSIAAFKGISLEDIERARISKKEDKGGFEDGLMLK